jgi:hypothetical protein
LLDIDDNKRMHGDLGGRADLIERTAGPGGGSPGRQKNSRQAIAAA